MTLIIIIAFVCTLPAILTSIRHHRIGNALTSRMIGIEMFLSWVLSMALLLGAVLLSELLFS